MTEYAKKLLRLYHEQSKKNRIIEGSLPLNFKGKGKDLKNYRIYGNTVNGESVGEKTANLFDENSDSVSGYIDDNGNISQGTNPITIYDYINVTPSENYYIKICGEMAALLTYRKIRIAYYSQDKRFLSRVILERVDNGETFETLNNCYYIRLSIDDGNTDIMLNEGSTALPYEPFGYKVPVTVEGKNLCNNIWEQKEINVETGNPAPSADRVCCDFIPVKPNVTYSCSRTIANSYNNLRCYGANKNYLGSGEVLANKANPLPQGASFGTFMITDARVSYIRFNDISNSLDTKYMLVEGVYTAETMPPYEPYHAPITTPAYLPEPIKIVGDEAEYIDYAEQKQYFADGTSTDVLLPALPTISGTNTLSVGTEVQPSKVEIKGKIKAVQEGSGENEGE